MPFHRITQRPAVGTHRSEDIQKLKPSGRPRDRFAVIALLFLVLTVSAPIAAYCDDDYTPGIVGIPLSDKFIAGEIHLANADKEVVKFIAREGSVVVVRGTDYHMAFSTRITPEGDVHLNYFNVTTVPGSEGGEIASISGCASAATGHFALPDEEIPFDPTDLPFAVRVMLVGDYEFVTPFFHQGEPIDPDFLLRNISGASCCARACDGTVICGCSVQTGCGGCCSGDCCAIGGGTLEKKQDLVLPTPSP